MDLDNLPTNRPYLVILLLIFGFSAGAALADTVILSVGDGYVLEVRLEGEALPTAAVSFGALKALYDR